MKTVLRSPSRLWIWIASVWVGFGMVDAAQTVFIMREQGMHHPWVKLFVVTVLFWLPWALATAPVIDFGRRFPPLRLIPLVTWAVHLAACCVIGLVFTAWTTWLERFFNIYAGSTTPGTFTELWFQKFLSGVLASLLLYAAILAISYVVESRARLAYQQTETARLNDAGSRAPRALAVERGSPRLSAMASAFVNAAPISVISVVNAPRAAYSLISAYGSRFRAVASASSACFARLRHSSSSDSRLHSETAAAVSKTPIDSSLSGEKAQLSAARKLSISRA